MAHPHRSHLKPELKLAARVLREHGAKPPVPIEAIAKHYADIEEDDLPTDADAVLLYPSERRKRPLIVLARDRARTRKRFTLAHELGHIVLPWHVGELAYSASFSPLEDFLYKEMEAEANRFASELLLPSDWLEEIIRENSDLDELVVRAKESDVSPIAMSLALAQHMKAGILVVRTERGLVDWCQVSPGTVLEAPQLGAPLDLGQFEGLVQEIYDDKYANSTYHWIRFGGESLSPKRTERPAREVLAQIVSGLRDSQKLATRISAVSGALNGNHKDASTADLVMLMKLRFTKGSEYGWLTAHPLFEEYLRARARDLRGE